MTFSTSRRKPRRRRLEHNTQVALFDWRAMRLNRWPEIALLHAIPNGASLKKSVRRTQVGTNVVYSAEGESLRREGMTKGIPDVAWPVPRGGHHGLYIEHKANTEGKKRTTSTEQRTIIALLIEQGYLVVVSYDVTTSIDVIERYWALGAFSSSGPRLESYTLPKPRRKTP